MSMADDYLIVDDNEVFRDRLARSLAARGLRVRAVGDYTQAMAALGERLPDRVILDLRMPGRGGLEVLRDLKSRYPEVRVVILSGYGSIATAVEAVHLGADNFVSKPASAEMILAAFERGTPSPAAGGELEYEAPSLARAEWEHINQVLADCDGNISRAARVLGLHRRTLQRKLQRYAPS